MPKTPPRFRIPLRIQGIFYNSLPLIAVLFSAGFAFFSNQQRERTELSLDRHFEMIENLVEIGSSLLSASAGVRGQLLTHDPSFAGSYTRAQEFIPQDFSRIHTLIESISKETRRAEKLAKLDAVQVQVNSAMDALASLSKAATPPTTDASPSPAEISALILHNQPSLDSAGKQLDDLRVNEQRLLSKRIEETRAARQRDYLLIFLSVLIGLATRAIALYFFHRRVIRRVRRLTENARNLRDGTAPVHLPSGYTDEIGELERELARVSEFLAERRIG